MMDVEGLVRMGLVVCMGSASLSEAVLVWTGSDRSGYRLEIPEFDCTECEDSVRITLISAVVFCCYIWAIG